MSPLSIPGKMVLKKESATADPYYDNVSLLLHGDGTNGSTTIVDNSSSPKTMTALGNAQISTTESLFGGSSLYFDGSGNDAIQTLPGNDFVYGTGPFTLEAWLYYQGRGSGGYDGAIIYAQTIGGQNYFYVLLDTIGDKFIFSWGIGGGSYLVTTGSVPRNVWTHVAVCREGTGTNQTRLFINGSVEAVGTVSFDFSNTTYVPTVGNYSHSFNALPYKGYIDDFRITKGIARYTSNFTPPTAPFWPT